MSFGSALDVAIGMVMTYLLLSIIATALQESLASMLSWRGKQLRDGLKGLLAGAPNDMALANHAMIRGTSGKDNLPSYAEATNFASAVIDFLAAGSAAPAVSQIEAGIAGLPDGDFKKTLALLMSQAEQDFDKFRAGVTLWYNQWMDRLSGDYKRFSQYFALAFGLLVAVALNVDSIHLARTLWTDRDARAAFSEVAKRYVAEDLPSLTSRIEASGAIDTLQALPLPLPIGWRPDAGATIFCTMVDTVFKSDGSGLSVIFGWLLTALAVSLGAPFWFDVLQQFMNLRGAGPKPNTKTA